LTSIDKETNVLPLNLPHKVNGLCHNVTYDSFVVNTVEKISNVNDRVHVYIKLKNEYCLSYTRIILDMVPFQ